MNDARAIPTLLAPQQSFRWLVGILIAVLLILLLGGSWFYRTQRAVLRAEAEQNLTTIANFKVRQIVEWRTERLADGQVLMESPFLGESIAHWLTAPTARATQDLLERFRSLQENYRYSDVLLVATNGDVRLSRSGHPCAIHGETREALAVGLREHRVLLTDLHSGPGQLAPHLDVVVPLFNKADGVGAIILRTDAGQYLYPLLKSWPVPSISAETLLIRRDGNEVLYLNEIRHKKDTALKLRIPLTRTNLPATAAVLGLQGVMTGKDYRGIPVVSVLKSVPDSTWFMVAKMDESEIFQGRQARSELILALLLVGILLAFSMATVVWQRNSKVYYRNLLQAEVAQHASEENFHRLFDSMNELAVLHELVYDAAGKVVDYRLLDCNPAFTQTTGITREQAVGRLASQVYGAVPFLENYAAVAQTGVAQSFEAYVEQMEKWFSISVFSPRLGQFATVSLDVTERKRAEEALRQSEERFSKAFNSSPVATAISRMADGQFVDVNEAACELYGYTRMEILGRTSLELGIITPEERQKIVEALKTHGAFRSVGLTIYARGGKRRDVLYSADSFDINGEPYMLNLILDITERKQAEKVRERLSHELTAKNEELESLLYAASHDLRSPLINIEGFNRRLEMACRELGELLQKLELSAELRPKVSKLLEQQIPMALHYSHSGVAKMNSLLRGLLQLSRLGRVVPKIEAVDMNQLLQQNLDAVRYQSQKANAKVTRDPVPPCLGDVAYLGQVFGNLLDNAIKYRDPDRPLEIHLSGRTEGPEAIYCVADTGLGIAVEHQEKIWELFHRLHPGGAVPGEGLGLNFVRRILIQQHGRAWVESVPGQGSRFFVALPAVTTT